MSTKPNAKRPTGKSDEKLPVIHETPLMYSDDKPHVLNDEADCWCKPGVSTMDGTTWVSHR